MTRAELYWEARAVALGVPCYCRGARTRITLSVLSCGLLHLFELGSNANEFVPVTQIQHTPHHFQVEYRTCAEKGQESLLFCGVQTTCPPFLHPGL